MLREKNILVIHSAEDSQWVERLKNFLQVLVFHENNSVLYWNETESTTDSLESYLSQTNAMVLLLSESFLNSVLKVESIRSRLQDKQKGKFPLFLLIVDKCKWKSYPWLKNLPVYPSLDRKLVDLEKSQQERTLTELVESISKSIDPMASFRDGILGNIQLKGVGHLDTLTFNPSPRLNIITGDNGYGKTLIMECIWWALTGEWAQYQVYPDIKNDESYIAFNLVQQDGSTSLKQKITYSMAKQKWHPNIYLPNYSTLVLYARADGSFVIWDSLKGKELPPPGYDKKESPLFFNKWDVFNGITEMKEKLQNRPICRGLIADWEKWYDTASPSLELLEKTIDSLSKDSGEPFEPAEPVEVPGFNSLIPTLKYSYGKVPIIHVASSVQRILSIAYLLTILWTKHKTTCENSQQFPFQDMIILIDEAESHLHPKWQRAIIPALLMIQDHFSKNMKIQFILTTHSPLLMASLEPVFNENLDSIFHFDMNNGKVELKSIPFEMHGRVDYWFTSDSFNLPYARSIDAEKAIGAAIQQQKADHPDPQEIKRIHATLCQVLGEFDPFWPTWSYFARQHGAVDDSFQDKT